MFLKQTTLVLSHLIIPYQVGAMLVVHVVELCIILSKQVNICSQMTIAWNLVDIKYENLFMLENCKVTKINNTIFYP